MKDIRCYLGFHDKEIVINLKTDRITKICKRCKIILNEADDNNCCASCIAADMNWKEQLKRQGKIVEI
jgi:hypothetical protein